MNELKMPIGSKVWINLKPIRHFGVYLGDNRVIHNSKRTNQVAIENLETFAYGHRIEFRAPKQTVDPNGLREKALQTVDQKYSISNFNCEHLVSYLLDDENVSRQLSYTMTSAGIGLSVSMAAGLSVKQTILVSCAFGYLGLASANAKTP